MNVIVQGMVFRVLCMIIIHALPIPTNIQVLLIFLTDFVDCEYAKLVSNQTTKICKTFQYQALDKVFDLFTYIFVAFLIKLPSLYFYIIVFRLLGVVLFLASTNSQWLILFPDVFKEVWVYNTFIEQVNAKSFAIIYFGKTLFEYYWHTYKNKNNYLEK